MQRVETPQLEVGRRARFCRDIPSPGTLSSSPWPSSSGSTGTVIKLSGEFSMFEHVFGLFFAKHMRLWAPICITLAKTWPQLLHSDMSNRPSQGEHTRQQRKKSVILRNNHAPGVSMCFIFKKNITFTQGKFLKTLANTRGCNCVFFLKWYGTPTGFLAAPYCITACFACRRDFVHY